MTAKCNFERMKPEDLTLELFSLQLELDQVPFGQESECRNIKISSADMSAVSTATTMPGVNFSGHHNYDLNRYNQGESMMMDHSEQFVFQHNAMLGTNQNNMQKSSDEGTVIDEDIMDVIHQSLNDVSSGQTDMTGLEVKLEDHFSGMCSVPLSVVTSANHQSMSPKPVLTPTSPTGSHYGSHSSQGGGPPTPPDISNKKKRLKTRHARDETHSHVMTTANSRVNTFAMPYESPPTPATPTTTPISSCPSSPGGHSGYLSQGSTKSNSSYKSDKTGRIPRHKRPSHIKAEYKRRNKIQGGIEDLQKLVPTISDSGNKDSKSSVLNKTADYIRNTMELAEQEQTEIRNLSAETEALRRELITYQAELPASGANLSQIATPTTLGQSQDSSKQQLSCAQMFHDYVNSRSLSNWKFWIFGRLIHPLFESYNATVSTTTEETFNSSIRDWRKQELSMVALRPAMFNFLRDLSDNTSIRSDPESVPDEILQTVISENFPASGRNTPQNSTSVKREKKSKTSVKK